MTQPTIAELRAMAQRERTQAMFGGHAATVMIIDSFLRYTDDRPLTADDCRLAGMIPMDGTSKDLECDAAIWCECGEQCVELLHPTVGQLNLCLDMEHERTSRGETSIDDSLADIREAAGPEWDAGKCDEYLRECVSYDESELPEK